MFAGSKNNKIFLISALLVVLVAGSSWAATIDPLLQGLARDKASASTMGLNYEKFLVVDSSKNSLDPTVGVILRLEGFGTDLSSVPGLVVGSQTGQFITARLPLSSLPWLEANDEISHVEAAHILRPLMDAARDDGRVEAVWNGSPAYTGAGVLVGVIDSGIDWGHADFDDGAGNTRIRYIWDMFGTGTPPAGFDNGVQYSENQINAGTLSEADYSGHGTHVTGIAAGNGFESSGLYSGVAPEADIIFVKAFDDNIGGFAEDSVIDAMVYLAGKAEELGQPMAINLSLGGHMGPHDGTSAQETIIDNLSGAGLVFCVAAGNEGEDDIHDSGPASGTSLAYTIPVYSPHAGTGNDYALLDIWVDGSSSPSVSVSYNGSTVASESSGNEGGNSGSYGTVYIWNATGPNPNGDKRIVVQLDDRTGTAPGAGNWAVNISGGTGTAHAWIGTSTMASNFPNSDQRYSVGMPGTSESAITVVAHKTKGEWPNANNQTVGYSGAWGAVSNGDHAPFSSFGPTRDDRQKPDICAPGMGMFAPYSADTSPYPGDNFINPSGDYLFSQGTSMATPFVCGVAALMFEKNGTLTAAQIKTTMRENAATDAFTGAVWNETFGAGKIDALAAVQAVASLGPAPTGDINGDSATSVLDLVLLANYIADPTGHPLDIDSRTQGDVYPAPNGDGVLNASDLARIVGFILESEEPGLQSPAGMAVSFELAQPLWQDNQWWQPVKILGQGVAAGQFALNLEGALWRANDLICTSGVQVTSAVAGTQLRVLLYELGGNFPSEGVELLVPFDYEGEKPATAHTAGLLMVNASGAPLDVAESMVRPGGFLQVSPNPSPGEMMVSFTRHSGGIYHLSVYDIRGHLVRGFDSSMIGQGNGAVVFDGRGNDGQRLPTGVYFMRLISDDQTYCRKIVLTR